MRIFGLVIMRASRYDYVTGDLLLAGLDRIRDELLGGLSATCPDEQVADTDTASEAA